RERISRRYQSQPRRRARVAESRFLLSTDRTPGPDGRCYPARQFSPDEPTRGAHGVRLDAAPFPPRPSASHPIAPPLFVVHSHRGSRARIQSALPARHSARAAGRQSSRRAGIPRITFPRQELRPGPNRPGPPKRRASRNCHPKLARVARAPTPAAFCIVLRAGNFDSSYYRLHRHDAKRSFARGTVDEKIPPVEREDGVDTLSSSKINQRGIRKLGLNVLVGFHHFGDPLGL